MQIKNCGADLAALLFLKQELMSFGILSDYKEDVSIMQPLA
ncbi:MAG: hypothetical protein JWQ09_4448 [Segetibacter sp.]|nr:hypothetical protein [Segetibacter sp.]